LFEDYYFITFIRGIISLSKKSYDYSELDENVIKIKSDIRKKGTEYGIISLTKSELNFLLQLIEFMSSSPQISPKFSKKIESYLYPRFNEIMGIISMNKALPEQVNIEILKETQKELLKGFNDTSVIARLAERKINYHEMFKRLTEIKMVKFQKK
jgi:hypothetical protein